MKINYLVVEGDNSFLKRRPQLANSFKKCVPEVEQVLTGDYYKVHPLGKLELTYMRAVNRLRNDGRDVWSVHSKSKRAFVTESKTAARIIEHLPRRPDHVLHMHTMYAPFVPGSKPPVPYSIITDYTQAQCVNWPLWQNVYERKNKEFIACQKLAYESASYIFTFSDVARESVCRDYGIAESKVKTVGSGGDIREVFVGEKNFGTKQLLVTGTDWIRKGTDIAVDAFRIVRKRFPETTLVILGDCGTPVIEPGIQYSGYVKDRAKIDEIFANTDIFLSPAHCDPFPGLALEAMNWGIPVVGSDKDGMPEMIDNGACGGIASLDASDFAAKIIALLSDQKLLQEKSDAARRRIREKYNWDTIARLMLDTWLADPAD